LINQKFFQYIEFCISGEFLLKTNELSDYLKGQSYRSEAIEINEIFIEGYFN